MTSEGWKRDGNGIYKKRGGKVDALVMQQGEIWSNTVWFEGRVVDQGEWDSRGTAFRNAERAMRHALVLRAPCDEANGIAARLDAEEDCSDDMG